MKETHTITYLPAFLLYPNMTLERRKQKFANQQLFINIKMRFIHKCSFLNRINSIIYYIKKGITHL